MRTPDRWYGTRLFVRKELHVITILAAQSTFMAFTKVRLLVGVKAKARMDANEADERKKSRIPTKFGQMRQI